jgi:hypothetical protein
LGSELNISKEAEPRKYLQVRKDLSSLHFSDFRSLNEPGKVSTAVLWIRLGFNAIRIPILVAKPIRPPLVRLSSHRRLNLYMKNILKLEVGDRSKNLPTKVKNFFLKGRKSGLFVNFCQFPCSWGSGSAFSIRIRIQIQDSQMIRVWIYYRG